MKKILFIVFSCLLISTLVGCEMVKELVDEFKGNDDSINEYFNSKETYDSLDEINEDVGVKIICADDINISDEEYYVMDDKIAQYNFKIGSNKFTIRGAYIYDEDISGILDEENNTFESGLNFSVYTDSYFLYRFFYDDIQYTISVRKPNNLDDNTFSSICSKIEDSIKTNSYDPLIGEYRGIASESVTCSIEKNGKNRYLIYINLSYSENEYYLWIINAKLDDNKLVYSKEEIETYDYSKDDPLVSDDIIQYDGYFEIEEENIYWKETSREDLKNYIFEKVSN